MASTEVDDTGRVCRRDPIYESGRCIGYALTPVSVAWRVRNADELIALDRWKADVRMALCIKPRTVYDVLRPGGRYTEALEKALVDLVIDGEVEFVDDTTVRLVER